MSDKPISKGDLVVVNKPLPCGCGGMGIVATVERIQMGARARCKVCKTVHPGGEVAILSNGRIKFVSRLKRIDPGILSEDVPTGEKVSA